MKTILVAGGAGEVGEGIVRQLLEAGHRVVVQTRSLDKFEALRERLGQPASLSSAIGNITSEEEIAALKEGISDDLDAVVATIGSWWSGPALVDLDLAIFNQVLAERLTTHFLVAKTFLPDLKDRPGSSYLFIHSSAGLVPIPHSGPVSIAGAAQAMMKDVFAKELEGAAVRINMLTMMNAIATRSYPSANPEALTADDVGRYVVYLVASEVRGQSLHFSHRGEIAG